MLRRTLPLLLVLVPLAARAQGPTTIQSGQTIQIPVPSNADKPRLQLLPAGTNLVLDDERARVDGSVADARLEADPGTYDIRVVANDRARTPLGPVARFQIPGFKREAGRWLFNGSPVVYEGANPATTTSFVPNLRRDKQVKLPLSVATGAVLKWDTLDVGATLDEMSRTGFDVAAFTANLRARMAQKPQIYLGFSVAAGTSAPLNSILPFRSDADRYKLVWPQLRAALNALAPDAALVFRSSYEEQVLDAIAPLADAIEVGSSLRQGDSDARALEMIKIARRNVEESANFDLPIFAKFGGGYPSADPETYLRAFQSGASNIIISDGTTPPADFAAVLARQSARFTGAVTLEDVGLRAKDFDRFAPILRRAGRVPLLARLPGEGNGEKKSDEKSAESLLVAFDATTDAATLDKIERAAKVGATIYCEGALPPALLPRWSEITKTQIAALPAPKRATLTLAEPWFWGTINDQNFDVSQSLSVSVKPSLAAQTKDVKGQARETVARPIARFNDDPNGIMLCPIGKGRVIWAPFDVTGMLPFTRLENRVAAPPRVTTAPRLTGRGLRTYIADKPFNTLDIPKRPLPVQTLTSDTSAQASSAQITNYYAAVAGAMQPALVDYAATKGDASGVTVALRALPADPTNPKTSAVTLAAFFNSSAAPVDLDANVRGDAAYALDLMTDQPVPVKVRDFGSRLSLSVPANGFRWIALAKDAAAWNDAGKGKVHARLR